MYIYILINMSQVIGNRIHFDFDRKSGKHFLWNLHILRRTTLHLFKNNLSFLSKILNSSQCLNLKYVIPLYYFICSFWVSVTPLLQMDYNIIYIVYCIYVYIVYPVYIFCIILPSVKVLHLCE